MAKYLMLGKYSTESLKEISAGRTKRAIEMIEKSGGKVISIYMLLGNYDIALIVDLPSNSEATKVSVSLSKSTNIGFTTFPAMTVEEFDKLVG